MLAIETDHTTLGRKDRGTAWPHASRARDTLFAASVTESQTVSAFHAL